MDLYCPAGESASPPPPSRANSSDATRAQQDEATRWHSASSPTTAKRQRPPWGRADTKSPLSPAYDVAASQGSSSHKCCSKQPIRSTTSLPPPLPHAPHTHRAFLLLVSLSLSLSHHSWLKLRWNFVFLSSEFGPGKSLPAIPVASQ